MDRIFRLAYLVTGAILDPKASRLRKEANKLLGGKGESAEICGQDLCESFVVRPGSANAYGMRGLDVPGPYA